MFDKINKTALSILNAVIWRLYLSGENRAAELIEKVRDGKAMEEYNKREKSKQDREVVYNRVARIYKEGVRFRHSDTVLIDKIRLEKTLGRLYFIMVKNVKSLKLIDNPSELYNRVGFVYLTTFEGFENGGKVFKGDLYKFRKNLSSVERSIRHIKADHPELFSLAIARSGTEKDDMSISTNGNLGLI